MFKRSMNSIPEHEQYAFYSKDSAAKKLPFLYGSVIAVSAVILLFFRHQTYLRIYWIQLPASLLLAHILYGFSAGITGLSLRNIYKYFLSSLFIYRSTFSIIHFQTAILISFGEEMVFRFFLQQLILEKLNNLPVAIIITSTLFSLIHLKKAPILLRTLKHIDFFVFSCILGTVFFYTRSLWPVVLVHALRNYVLRTQLIYINNNENIRRIRS